MQVTITLQDTTGLHLVFPTKLTEREVKEKLEIIKRLEDYGEITPALKGV